MSVIVNVSIFLGGMFAVAYLAACAGAKRWLSFKEWIGGKE